jgi:glycosyltransferase involved in cell wall biosynthesis
MRVLFHSPGTNPTGYGQQTALFVPLIASLGHEVAISAFHAVRGAATEWNGHRVYPAGHDPYGSDVLREHARHFGADLVITLMDVWALKPDAVAGLPVAHWMPVDCDDGGGLQGRGLSLRDHVHLRAGGGVPVAMSRFGEAQLRKSGHDPLYVPHGIDTNVWKPPEDRKALREAMGTADCFVVGINAANIDKTRKAWPEQLAAFARLHRRHSDTRLFAHTFRKTEPGLNLAGIARDLGIADAIMWPDEYMLKSGLITPEMLAATCGTWDLYSGCAMAEGFGLPVLEAEACGVPSVVTDGSAMAEVGAGWKVPGEPAWSELHAAWWRKPSVDAIAKVYEKAYQGGPSYEAKKAKAREHALAYDVQRVLKDHWEPALKTLEERLCG